MTEDEFDQKVNRKPKSITFLWAAILVLFLASAVLIVGIWKSFRNDKISNNLALSNSIESGDVLGATTESPDYLIKLADSLKTDGVILYGFDGNQETKRQLAIFGQAITNLDYVECNSQSSHSNADECVARGIDKYPTWVKGEQKSTGFKTLEELEQMLAN